MDEELLNLYFGNDQDALKRAKVQADLLRKRRTLANLGIAMNNPVSVALGKNELGDVNAYERLLAEAPQARLKMAMEKQKLRADEMEQGQKQMEAQRRTGPLGTLEQYGLGKFAPGMNPQGITAADYERNLPVLAKAFEAEQARRNAAMNRGQMRQAAEDERDERKVQALGKDMDLLPALLSDIDVLESASDTAAPGVGPVVGRLPDVLVSDEGIVNRQAALRAMMNLQLLKSGKAVTEAEARRALRAYGLGEASTAAARKAGVEKFRKEMTEAVRNAEAKYPDRIKSIYSERGGFTSASIPASRSEKPTGREEAMEKLLAENPNITREEMRSKLKDMGL